MKSRNILPAFLGAAGMLVLVLDSRRALAGMREGIEICLEVLIPSLFPFFVLSGYLTGNLMRTDLKFLGPVGRLCGIPRGAECLLVTGFLGGYPVGAQNVAMAWRRGQVSREDAARMLMFCSNAGPAFFFGVIGQAFDDPKVPWGLWGIHMLSALLVGALGRPTVQPAPVVVSRSSVSLPDALRQALSAMAQVCGWVVLFRMLLTYLEGWFLWLLPRDWQIIAGGILELANGCVRLREIDSEPLRFVVASALTALGGVCVTMQTVSVARGLPMGGYLRGKLLQSCLSVVLAWCVIRKLYFLWIPVLVLLFLPRKSEKNSSFPTGVGV